MRTTVSLEGMNALLDGSLGRPADVLGPQTIHHEGRKMLAVRAFLPDSQQAWVARVADTAAAARCGEFIRPACMKRCARSMLLNIVSESPSMPAYQLRVADREGEMTTLHDPYAFAPLMTDFDLHLLRRREAAARLRQAGRPGARRSTACGERILPSGRRTPGASASSATSTIGTGGGIR